MKKIQFAITLIIITVISFSCESYYPISLTVVDKITKQPLDSVLVKVTDSRLNNLGKPKSSVTGYTDINGNFYGSIQFGFGKHQINSEFRKNGYVTKTEFNKTTGKVELEH